VISRVGEDELGRELRAELKTRAIPMELVQRDQTYPTGTVHVEMEEQTHRFRITEKVAWDFIALEEKAITIARKAKAICFGSLGQRNKVSRSTILRTVEASSGLIVFDINLRQTYFARENLEESLAMADVLKLNHEEGYVLNEIFTLNEKTIEGIGRKLLQKYKLDLVCVTRGGDGAIMINAAETIEQPGRKVEVVDTVGCGDAFTASLVNGLLKKKDLRTIAQEACRHGEFVATQTGAMPLWT